MNIMKKIKEGPTVTMFVPYDCNNSCPFCVNKEEYRNSSSFDLDRCYRSLDLLDRIFPHNDVVFTGGEPLAELEALEDIIDQRESGYPPHCGSPEPPSGYDFLRERIPPPEALR